MACGKTMFLLFLVLVLISATKSLPENAVTRIVEHGRCSVVAFRVDRAGLVLAGYARPGRQVVQRQSAGSQR